MRDHERLREGSLLAELGQERVIEVEGGVARAVKGPESGLGWTAGGHHGIALLHDDHLGRLIVQIGVAEGIPVKGVEVIDRVIDDIALGQGVVASAVASPKVSMARSTNSFVPPKNQRHCPSSALTRYIVSLSTFSWPFSW